MRRRGWLAGCSRQQLLTGSAAGVPPSPSHPSHLQCEMHGATKSALMASHLQVPGLWCTLTGALRQSGTPTARCAVASFFCFHVYCSRRARPCCHRRWRHGRLDQDPPGAALLSSPCVGRLAAGSTHLLCCGSLLVLQCRRVPPRHLHPPQRSLRTRAGGR